MAPTLTNIPEQIEKYIRDSRPPVDFTRPLDSPMVNFYSGRCVFLTGGTGFLGQLFVEKLLRTGVRRVYVLARPKRGRSTTDRLRETFTGDVFARLLADDPRYMDRVRAVDGDMGKPQMGISPEDWAELVANVHIVLHSAAEVRFDESLKHLLLVNLRGTREVLRLAEACVDLAVFAHISTAYSHCPHERIDEVFYEVPYAPKLMIELAEGLVDGSVNEQQFHDLTGKVIEPWPNTYAFTKALAEQLVREFGERIPAVVMRPSIVIATHLDPIPGWINNIYGLTGVLLASGMGFQRVLPYTEHLVGDFVCADFVINSTLAAAWATWEESKTIRDLPPVEINNNEEISTKNISDVNEIINDNDNEIVCPSAPPAVSNAKVYHVISYQDRPLTYKEVQVLTENTLWEMPSEKSLWLPTANTTNWRWIEFFYILLYHVVPAMLFDVAFWVSRSKFRLMPMYRKAQKFMAAQSYFMRREWAFGNAAMKSVYARMSMDDRRFFPGDVREFNFREYVKVYYMGIRVYVLKEKLVNQGRALRRLYMLRTVHCGVLAVLYTGYALLAYAVLLQFGWWNAVAAFGVAGRQALLGAIGCAVE